MDEQLPLDSLDVWEDVPAKRPPRAGRMRYFPCATPGCPERVLAVHGGLRCGECKRADRERRRESGRKPARGGRASEHGYVDEFPPGY